MKKFSILLICTGNRCRSQMAEGYLKYFSDKLSIDVNVLSAGVKAEGLNPKAIETMSNDNIDISNQTSNTIDEYINEDIIKSNYICLHMYVHMCVWGCNCLRLWLPFFLCC